MVGRIGLAVILVTTLAVRAHASCPLDTLQCPSRLVSSPYPVDRISDTQYCGFDQHAYSAGANALYDLTQGQLQSSAYGSGGFCGDAVLLITHDDFTLLGPAGSSPITFTAQIAVNGSGNVAASIQEGSSAPVSVNVSGQTVLAVRIARSPGDHFALRITSSANAYSGTSNITSALSFPDLPPGCAVISCQGYSTGTVVPVRAATWGHLKLTYR